MAADEPSGDGMVKLVEMAGKKMVGVIDDGQVVLTRERRDEFGNSGSGAVLIVGALDEKFGLRATPQIREIGVADGNSQPHQIGDARIGTANAKADPTPKTEAGKNLGDTGKLCGKKIDGGLNVVLLAMAAIL